MTRRGRLLAVVLAVVLGSAGAIGPSTPAGATWGDAGTVTSGSFSAYSVPAPPAPLACESGTLLNGNVATISWTAVTTPHALTYSAILVDTGTGLTVHSSGTNRWVQVTNSLLSTLLGQTVTIQVRAHPPGPGDWASPPTERRLHKTLLGLSINCAT